MSNSYVGKHDRLYGNSRKAHIVIAEMALGKSLPDGAEVHHVNGVRNDNDNANLVVCPSREYHRLLHARQKALDACGHADWLRCCFCKTYDSSANLTVTTKNKGSAKLVYHKECNAAAARRYRGNG